MSEHQRQFIVDELSTLPRVSIDRLRAKLICPFHNDTNPSGTVNLDETAARAPLGWFRCWSCKASKPYNDLAEQLGLRKYKNKRTKVSDYVDPTRFKKQLLAEKAEEESFERDFKSLAFFDFQIEEWRGFNVEFLKKLGAKFCYWDWTEDFFVWFP